MRERFCKQIARSKFVLCPRGVGCSSYRLFEVMSAGRIPVIISDEWVKPPGPRWDRFSVRVAEREVTKIPDLLRELAPDVPRLMREASAAYAEFYSSRRLFSHLGDCLDDLLAQQKRSTYRFAIRRWRAYSGAAWRAGRKRVSADLRKWVKRVGNGSSESTCLAN